jgi:hypothetical protein
MGLEEAFEIPLSYPTASGGQGCMGEGNCFYYLQSLQSNVVVRMLLLTDVQMLVLYSPVAVYVPVN